MCYENCRNNHEFTKNDVVMTFNDSEICLMVLKCCVYDSEKLLNDFEMFFHDLSSSSKDCGSLKNFKGGGGLRPPSPL